jgi:anti-sigma regulatory factor (Ser/Thr protein kinase)
MALPLDVSSARAARAFVRDICEEWQVLDLTETAELVASELVTNAVRHASSSPTIRLCLSERAVRIEVDDLASAAPAPVVAGEDAESGRGLFLVDALCAAWGVATGAAGKTVWAELPLPATP